MPDKERVYSSNRIAEELEAQTGKKTVSPTVSTLQNADIPAFLRDFEIITTESHRFCLKFD